MALARRCPTPLPGASGRLISDAEALGAVAPALGELAAAAADANPFFEPPFLLATLRLLPPPHDFAAFVATDQAGGPQGFFPFARRRFAAGLGALCSFVFPHSAQGLLGTPLLRSGREADAVDALLDALDAGALGLPLLEFRKVAADSAFLAVLRRRLAARGQPWLHLGLRDRAVFVPRASAEDYLDAAASGRRRRKLARLRRQLEAQGRLALRRLGPEEDPTPWADALLRIEAAGWKGRAGSALASRPGGERFFREVAAALHAEDRLLMYGLWLDDRPVAIHSAMRSASDRGQAFMFKITYDEAFADQSPGVQLEIRAIAELLHGPEPMARLIDSCADSDQQLWRDLWLDRRELARLLVGPRGARGRALIEGLRVGRWLRHELVRLRERRRERPHQSPYVCIR